VNSYKFVTGVKYVYRISSSRISH